MQCRDSGMGITARGGLQEAQAVGVLSQMSWPAQISLRQAMPIQQQRDGDADGLPGLLCNAVAMLHKLHMP
jgi:hypothetical protein